MSEPGNIRDAITEIEAEMGLNPGELIEQLSNGDPEGFMEYLDSFIENIGLYTEPANTVTDNLFDSPEFEAAESFLTKPPSNPTQRDEIISSLLESGLGENS